jgi:hypothetical protein
LVARGVVGTGPSGRAALVGAGTSGTAHHRRSRGGKIELPRASLHIGPVSFIERSECSFVVAEHGRLEFFLVSDPIAVTLAPGWRGDPCL